ncbi:hypothetical protein [Arcobacter cloacae]|uniref:Uncharacterized protein n=1 Tax=Arcobacter cloacae TaxID=1054034 RepID=A0A6M8N8K7_9BACT|nr:hypothetical protein [Arcobacter cloacae]QKF90398.1 hypothetical protein ACLO_1916 [Arcobacter cloacae]RXI39601.1 hypothetical protein CP963_09700 [Arcobacter cloacae]
MKKPYLSDYEVINYESNCNGKTITETIEDTDNDIIIMDFGMASTATVEGSDYDNNLIKE